MENFVQLKFNGRGIIAINKNSIDAIELSRSKIKKISYKFICMFYGKVYLELLPMFVVDKEFMENPQKEEMKEKDKEIEKIFKELLSEKKEIKISKNIGFFQIGKRDEKSLLI